MAEWNRDHGLGHVSLRPARRSDWSDLAKLARQTDSDAFRDSMESSALELHLERNLSDSRIGEMLASDTFLLAMAGKEIVGFVQYSAWKADPSFSGSFETAYPRPVEVRRIRYDSCAGLGRENEIRMKLPYRFHAAHRRGRVKGYRLAAIHLEPTRVANLTSPEPSAER